MLEAGAIVAGYRLDRKVGSGGMGVIWRATDLSLERPVALKLIRPDLAADPSFRKRFTLEAKLAASLDHAHVLPVYEAGEADGQLYLAMRFVDGYDLAAVLAAEGRLEAGRAARLLAQVASALDAAHAAGLVHRDVKPANILLAMQDGAEHAYLSDFGLTVHVSSAITRITAGGQFVGTVSYAAPEQLRAEPVDARTDVYALGCVLFHSLTGEVPYPRKSDTAAVVAHLSDPVPRPSQRAPGTASAFDAIVARALAKAPDDRYQSAGELGRMAVAAASRPAAGSTVAAGVSPALPPVPPSMRARGARLVALTLAFVVVTIAGIAIAAGAPWREESGRGTSAGAQNTDDQVQQEHTVGLRSICDGVNAENNAVPKRLRQLKRRLDRGAVTLRVGLIEELNRELRAGDDLAARLEALTPPDARAAAVQRATSARWSRVLDRLRRERDALELAHSKRAVVRAAMAPSLSAAERDRLRIRAGLLALGGRTCRLDRPPDRPRIESGGRNVTPRDAAPPPAATRAPTRGSAQETPRPPSP